MNDNEIGYGILDKAIEPLQNNSAFWLSLSVKGAVDKAKTLGKDVLVIKDGDSFCHCDPKNYKDKNFINPILCRVQGTTGKVIRGKRERLLRD